MKFQDSSQPLWLLSHIVWKLVGIIEDVIFRSGSCAVVSILLLQSFAVADPEGGQGVRSNPPFRQNHFNFMGIFMKVQVKVPKRTPLWPFEPPHQKSWIRPCLVCRFDLPFSSLSGDTLNRGSMTLFKNNLLASSYSDESVYYDAHNGLSPSNLVFRPDL